MGSRLRWAAGLREDPQPDLLLAVGIVMVVVSVVGLFRPSIAVGNSRFFPAVGLAAGAAAVVASLIFMRG